MLVEAIAMCLIKCRENLDEVIKAMLMIKERK